MGIISMGRGPQTIEALTLCQQASSNKAWGSSAWVEDHKPSRHLLPVNRRAAASRGNHQHGSRTTNHRGTYFLSTGEQQQGMGIISMSRGPQTIEALTACQQASSSKAWGSSAWVKDHKPSRHLLPVNRRAAARHGDHQRGSRTTNHRGTYQLSTGEQQQGMGIISVGQGPQTIEALTACQQASSSKAWGSSAWAQDHKPSRHLLPVNRQAAARHGDHQRGSRTTNHRGTYQLSTGEQQQGMGIISMGRRLQTIEALTSCQQASSSKAWGSSAWVEDHKSSRHLPTVNRRAAARHGDHQHGSKTTNHRGTYQLSTGEQQQGMGIISVGRGPQTIEALTACQQASSSKAWGSSAWVEDHKPSRHLLPVNRRAAARHGDHQRGSRTTNHRGTYFLSTGEQQRGVGIISMGRGPQTIEALTLCQQASSSKAWGSSAWVEDHKPSRHLLPVNRRAAARHGDHQRGSRTTNHRGTYCLSTGEQQQGMGIISVGRGPQTIEALTSCQQASSSEAWESSAWVEDHKPSRHLLSVNRRAAARHGDHQRGSRTTNHRGTYFLSTGEQQQGMGIISVGRGPQTIEALTACQQASSSKAWGSSAWVEDHKPSRHLLPVNRRAAARRGNHQHGSRTTNHRGTYCLSTGEQQQGMGIISVGRGPQTIEALTFCQQASSSEAWESSAWVEDHKPSRHLLSVNRRAAARRGNHQHGSRTTNHRGTYILSTGEQQQGMGIISVGRGPQTIEALTLCQQASSSKAWGSSAWVEDYKPSRHLLPVNRQAAARHGDHQRGPRTTNHRGTYFLSTGKQQQGMGIISVGPGPQTIEALTNCQQASSSKAWGSSAWVEDYKPSRHLLSVNRQAAARHGDHQRGPRTTNHRGTYFLSTGKQQQGMGIISVGPGPQTIEALTNCQQASSSKAWGSSAWAQDHKPSRHLRTVNRRAAARRGNHQHGSRTTNHRGTYFLSTGEQQQGMGIVSMDRGPQTIEALTPCQEASSSKAWGSSAWVEDYKPSRHLLPVNRRAAARHGDHQHGSRTTNHRGTYELSTGEQQQGMGIVSMGRGPQTIEALTYCQQASSEALASVRDSQTTILPPITN
ncbi:hypothetical protein EDD22DRAFT_850074 [Suillus occidentalis]|nr:hypothetical protein EDD22DRAFT_850074 [Suillus occidentalis]